MNFMKKNGIGILLCLVIAIPAWFLGKMFPVIGGAVPAIIAGMIITMIWNDKGKAEAGIKWTSKVILQSAVVLLGFGMNLGVIFQTGKQSLPIIVCTITTSLIIAWILQKILKVPANTSILVGVGSSICGGSAIAATAPVIKADDEEIAQSISVVFLFNVLAALIFPTLGDVIGLTNEGFGLFAGTAINDTSSVTAAASVWDTLHGTGGEVLEYATIVKLTRTLAIIPITIVLSVIEAKKTNGKGHKLSILKMIPTFIIYFVLASALTTIVNQVFSGGALAAAGTLFAFLKKVSKFFIVMAMSAIGINTDIVKLIKTGAKPIALGFICWVMISVVSLAMQHVLGMW